MKPVLINLRHLIERNTNLDVVIGNYPYDKTPCILIDDMGGDDLAITHSIDHQLSDGNYVEVIYKKKSQIADINIVSNNLDERDSEYTKCIIRSLTNGC